VRTRQISPYYDIVEDDDGSNRRLVVYRKGYALLRHPLTNKGIAFTPAERDALGLEGLLPPKTATLDEQLARVYAGYEALSSPIDKYQYLRALQERNEVLFFALLAEHLEEMSPVVYTPTVGDAVRQFNALYQTPRGLSLSTANIYRWRDVASNYPLEDVRMIVVTDNSAILGIGDQGYGGLAIPIGKLALYTVGGGVSPFHTLPISLDVGTTREDLRRDPFYLGVPHKRLTGAEYMDFVEKFVKMVEQRWPNAVIQWEDLAKDVAYEVLERYRDRVPSFNDDIQGTGAVALAGVQTACARLGQRLRDQTVVILGAGAGGAGVAWAIRRGLEADGLSPDEAARRVLVLDSRGLLTSDRKLTGYKAEYAQPAEAVAGWGPDGRSPSLIETIIGSEATVLLGLSGQPGTFDEPVVRAMADRCERPIIFPLSNPTSASEATPAEILSWTDGRAIVATGSPFDPVVRGGVKHPIGQGNNVFIFPGLGLGTILANARRVSDAMVLAASTALAKYTTERWADAGLIYPPVSDLAEASVQVATAVVKQALSEGNGALEQRWIDRGAREDLEGYVRAHVWKPRYLPVVAGETRPF